MKASAKDGSITLNKTALALKEIAGIDVIKEGTTDEIKNMADIVAELGEKWKTLSDTERAALSEGIAGAEQASVFQSLMANLEIMKQVQSELANGEHFESMEKENAAYVDSIAGQLNKLKETWIGVFTTLVNSDSIKNIVKGLVTISEAIAKVITMLDETGMLTPVLVGLGTALASKAFKSLPSLFASSSESASGLVSVLPNLISGFNNMNPPVSALGGSFVNLGTRMSGFLSMASTFAPWAVGAAVAVGALTIAVDKSIESLDEEKSRLSETINARKQEISSVEEQKSKLKGLQQEYDKLSSKPKKTADEVERLAQLTNEIGQIRPDLVIGTDETGNTILSLTGSVKDLITEMDRANESKKKLLSVEQGELAQNSVKQLHGNLSAENIQENTESLYAPKGEMAELETLTQKHIKKMNDLESERDKVLNKLYGTTGKERQKLLKDLDKANYNIEKQQSEFNASYQQQLDVIKEYSSQIGESIFSSLENGSFFRNMTDEKQSAFSKLKQSLDFSDIKTEDQLLEVEMALNKLMKSADKIDLAALSNSLQEANAEFTKTGDAEKYSKAIDDIIASLEKTTGQDFSNLKDVFEGIDTSVLKGKDALEEFLQVYGKTKEDINNGDGFAKALANQKRQLEQVWDELNNITGDAELDIELACNIINNDELPNQLREMVAVLLRKGQDPTDVLQLTQDIIYDLSTGNVNIDELNQKIVEAFGEGAFEITPEIFLSENTKIEGVETVIKQLQDKFGEIPTTVKTVIEANGVTAYDSAEKIKKMYDEIPEEVQTTMKNNGQETLRDIILVNDMINMLPSEVVSNIITNYPDVLSNANNIEDIINSLPSSVLMDIKSNYPDVAEKLGLVKDALDNIPATVNSKVSVTEEIQNDSGGFFNKLFKKDGQAVTANAVLKTQVQGEQSLINVDDRIKSMTQSVKTVEFNADASDVDQKTTETQKNLDNIKQKTPTKVEVDNISANKRLKTTKSHLDEIKSKTVTLTVNTNYTTTGTASPQAQRQGLSARSIPEPQVLDTVTPQNEISLLSDNNNAETLANTGVENLSRAKLTPNQVLPMFNNNVNMYKDIETALKKVSNELDIVNKKTELAFGKEKEQLLQKQAELYKKQQEYQHQLAESMRVAQNELKYYLTQKGIQFDKEGQVINYKEKLLSIEQQINSINNKEKQTDADKSKVEQLNKTKEALEEYLDLTFDKLPSASKEWWSLQESIEDARYELEKFRLEQKLLTSNHKLKELDNLYKSITNSLDFIDKKSDNFYGGEKINLLKQQVELIEQQKQKLHELAETYRSQIKTYQTELSRYGFSFDKLGNITDIDGVLNKITDTKKLEKATELLEEYLDIQNDKLPDASASWWDLNSTMKETLDTIEKLNREQKLFVSNNKLLELQDAYDGLTNSLEFLEAKESAVSGKDKLDILDKKLDLLEQQKDKLHEIAETYREQLKVYQADLGKYGFTFDVDGNIKDIDGILNKFKDSTDFEKVKDLVEEYLDIQKDKIPDLSKEWWELQSAIKSALKEQLETTKDIQDKITDIYKKQVEERKKLIEDELDSKLKALKKEQDAYNKQREEVDYQNDYQKQLDEVMKIQQKLELAAKDTSLSGQKKYADLLEELTEAQEKLEKLVQDKIDSDVNDFYDKESNKGSFVEKSTFKNPLNCEEVLKLY